MASNHTSSFDAGTKRYSLTAIVLHWVLGLALIGIFAVGLYMTDLPFSPTRLKLYNWHKWAGITDPGAVRVAPVAALDAPSA